MMVLILRGVLWSLAGGSSLSQTESDQVHRTQKDILIG